MGTKAKSKTRPNEVDDSAKKAKKTKRIFLFRMVRKRKRLSQSQEFLHDPPKENFKTDIERDDQDKEREVEMDAATNVIEHVKDSQDDIVNDSTSHDEADHPDDDRKMADDKHKSATDEKIRLFSSPIKFLKNSFSSKKRRKQNEYSKFSESTDNFFAELDEHDDVEDECVVGNESSNRKQTKKTNSDRYVRFETVDDDDKENMAMTIDENDAQPHSSSSSTQKKKKKSAKKRVSKAGRKTGRVFREGMIQIGRNLQYLTPIPTPHVFADNTKKKADYTDKPKKRTYKYTASAPPSNPYGFV